MELLEIASALVKAGYSVIPVEYEEKKPAVAWKEYQDRYPNEEELDFWFNGLRCNIGIVTGSISNLVVVDIDPRNGGKTSIDGYDLGRVTSITGGNGYHYYYRYFPEASQTKPGLWPGVDIKSDGGYVLCPPSKTTGNYYWSPAEPFPPLRREPQDWLREAISKADNKKSVGKVSEPKQFDVTSGRGNLQFRVTFKDVPEGGRNNYATRLYGALLYEGVSIPRAMDVLKLWNSELTNPLPNDELTNIFNSITERHVKKIKENKKV